MITLPEYIVLGGDGKEYGPVSAGQIREWIAEDRVEKKTPVKPPGAKDWVFVESLPEFAEAFGRAATSGKPGRVKSRRTKWLLAAAVVLLAGIVLLALKSFKPH